VKWLFDTNVVSESIRGQPDRTVLDWVTRQAPEETAISIVTMAELSDGIRLSPDEKRHALQHWLDTTVAPSFRDRILDLNLDVLTDWLRLNRRLAAERATRKAADLLIAATARVHGLTVVTRNARDFAGTGVVVYDPWNDKTHRVDEL
jgi:tRNA(fMet)-specific endonuclease VapC